MKTKNVVCDEVLRYLYEQWLCDINDGYVLKNKMDMETVTMLIDSGYIEMHSFMEGLVRISQTGIGIVLFGYNAEEMSKYL
jgi:hypothetical protein